MKKYRSEKDGFLIGKIHFFHVPVFNLFLRNFETFNSNWMNIELINLFFQQKLTKNEIINFLKSMFK